MPVGRSFLLSILTVFAITAGPSAAANNCDTSAAVQILGSGGPIAEGHRAASSAVVWIDGKAALLIDAGSGSFVRYGQADVNFEDLQAILITHFHADHVGDLAAILNSGGFADRKASLPVIGPVGNDQFPGVGQHLRALFDEKSGAFRYLSGFLDGRFGLPKLLPREVDVEHAGLSLVLDHPDLQVSAIAVHHGDAPSLAYVVRAAHKVIVFAGDQSFLSEDFVATLKGTRPDLLIMHNVIPEGDGQPRGLHRWPQSIGEVAAALKPGLLVLSHNMERALRRQQDGESAIRRHYRDKMQIADDLDCFAL